jgi:two-component system CheB/CheR fusion protein
MARASPEHGESPPSEGLASLLPFPVVGVGASAGGLEAISSLLERIPRDPGMAFVVILHLDPHYKSELPSILSKITPLPVRQVTEGTEIEINHVYVGPPNASVSLAAENLTLTPRPRRGVFMPIDILFRSLAGVQKSAAIGVVLSGEGTDGTIGLQAIKAEGGIAFAQDDKSARHDSMPRSAVAEGYIDYVLPPDRIAEELVRIARHPYAAEAAAPEPRLEGEERVDQVIGFVRENLDIDFGHYKRSTIKRRIERRMAVRNKESLDDYLQLLRSDSAEMRALYQDFLIRVTQFFRDSAAFEALKGQVFPNLVKDRSPANPIRIWVAGCSSGEEVYSLAIGLWEFLGNQTNEVPLKILATDLDESALEKARQGVYLDNVEVDVSPERLRRFFNRSDGCYKIIKSIREQCVFSRHNLAHDPPFSHLDLVSCRNVLIYMDAALQRRILPILHYALNPGGALFLGSSETIGPFGDLFAPLDAKYRIFTKKAVTAAVPMDLAPFTGAAGGLRRGGRDEGGPPLWSALDVQREADRIVLSRYAPVGVVIDEAMTVLQFRGRTAPYLEPAPGMASLDLLRMLREGLLAEVRAAINQARSENAAVIKEGVAVIEPDGLRRVKVEVIPFKLPSAGTRFFLVLFQDGESPEGAPAVTPERHPAVPPEQQTQQLQQELAALREYLQSVIEEQESTNEELKSANEEILSANEELQSTNEELQTAKEEAQSANEELATVNEELRHRNAELARVNNDLVNLLSGVNIPIVMVNRDLRIRRFTPMAEKVLNLIPTDMGRPISDIKPNLHDIDLAHLIAGVIDSLTPLEREVRDHEGHWFSLRIRPYVTLDNIIDGASVVLARYRLDPQGARSDARGEGFGVGRWEAEVRGQRSEVRGRKSEVRSQASGVRG